MTERYTLLAEIGRGGMGVVWKARDEQTGSMVAFKRLREVYAEDPGYIKRFERELELAKRIHSRNVVRVVEYGVTEGTPYLALEFVNGKTLREHISAHGPYTWAEAKPLLTQITQGLSDAHAAGVIHRDLKPANILIDSNGVAKIADFGIARGLDLSRVTGTATLLGTPAYLAPEGPADERSDLYSLGIIAYEILTGVVPFEGRTYQEVILRHVREAPDLTRLPEEARPIVAWLLDKNPEDRPQRASDLLPVLYGASLPAAVSPTRVADAPTLSAQAVAPRRVARPAVPAPDAWPTRIAPTQVSSDRATLAQDAPTQVVPAQDAPTQVLAAQTVVVRKGPAPVAPPSIQHSWHPARMPGWWFVGLVIGLVAAIAVGTFARSSTPTPTPTPTPTMGAFSHTGSIGTARISHTATLLPDGRVLIVGGTGNIGVVASAELYDPKTGTFTATGSMGTACVGHTATLLPDGRVLIVGGTGDNGIVASAELYDPKTGTFTATGSMGTARIGHTATLLPDGRVLIAGGSDVQVGVGQGGANNMLASAELYDPRTGAFSPTGSMATARGGHTATMLRDGRVLIAGGADSWATSFPSAEVYDPKTGTFSQTGSMAAGRAGHTATLLGDGRVLIAGGELGAYKILAGAELYDPNAGTFSPTGSMASARSAATATLLSDGRVLIAGSGGGLVELYDPATGAFSPTGSMIASRVDCTATLLSDGQVLVVGGTDGMSNLASAELYTP